MLLMNSFIGELPYGQITNTRKPRIHQVCAARIPAIFAFRLGVAVALASYLSLSAPFHSPSNG